MLQAAVGWLWPLWVVRCVGRVGNHDSVKCELLTAARLPETIALSLLLARRSVELIRYY